MNKLNTLEDLEFEHEWNEVEKPLAVWSDDLRKEAIRWIKEIDNFKKSSEDLQWEALTGKTIEYSKDSMGGLRNWIKYFFNLSEEDIK